MISCIIFSNCKNTPKTEVSTNKSIIPATKELNIHQKKWTNQDGFSIAIIPDTQRYVDFLNQKPLYVVNQWEIFNRQTKYIAENSIINGGDFSFALHVGDVVDHRSHVLSEWTKAAKCMNNLNGQIPFLIVPGNHDYDTWDFKHHTIGSGTYNLFFGPKSKYFKNKTWYKGSYATGRNSYAIFNGADRKFLVIGLELNPDQKTINWARSILNNHKELPCIILIHQYITVSQGKTLTDSKWKNFYFADTNYRESQKGLIPQELWNQFISQHDQIFLVVCGHSYSKNKGAGYRVDKNAHGYTTYSILSNFQSFNNYLNDSGIEYKKEAHGCGDGWMSILDINFTNKSIDFSCYNTETKMFLHGEPYEMSFPIDWDWEERFSKTTQD